MNLEAKAEENYMVNKILRLPPMDAALEEPLAEEVPEGIYDAFTLQFPVPEDLIKLARHGI